MNNELQIFNNSQFGQVRGVEIEGKPYVVGNDVAIALEYSRPYEAITAHCKGAVSYRVIDSLGREQDTKVIPTGDVFRLIVKAADQSKNLDIRAKAEAFEKWIFDDVLPTIQRHGMYATDDLINDPDLAIKAFTALKEARARNNLLQSENQLLAQQTVTWSSRKVLEAVVKKYGFCITNNFPMLNGYQEAWREFKKELLYMHSINLNLRITNYMNNSGKKTAPKTLDMIHDEELSRCISTAVAMCRNHNVDISEIIEKYQSPVLQ
jgi:prophage antirepressor-like protein